MSLLKRNFRQWWQPPRKVGTGPAERQVTFLELFYDLVYVVLIAELAHALSAHIGWTGLGSFAFLFIIVWWAWFNGTSYHDLHGNNDIRTRIFTFLQMLSVIAMAVFAHDALGDTSVGFAWSYAAFQLILTYLWWRTGVHDSDHRPLSRPYVISFLITTLLFITSTFIAAPVRFYFWGAALLVSLLMPMYTFFQGKRNPEVQAQIDLVTTISPSMVERFGLFTIIVLGEVIVGVVSGVTAHHHLDWLIGITGALGAFIAIGLWWVYFDYVSHHLPRPGAVMVSGWFYLHLPLTMGIASVGAAVLNVVERAGDPLDPEMQWLLVGAIAVSLISIAILDNTIQIAPEHQQIHQAGRRVMVAAAVLIGLLGLTRLEAIPMLMILVLLMLAPIFTGLRSWLAVVEAER